MTKTRHRFGPLFSDRFKSVLVEPRERVIQMMAAYIDLNCVRAGITQDPRHYRFCGYAEAVAGRRSAQAGLMAIAGASSWTRVQASYRQTLFGVAAGPREQGNVIPLEVFRRVVEQGGQLPLATVLRCRLRYFNDGAVIGSRIFVEDQLARYRSRKHKRPRTAPRPLPAVTDWGELTTLRSLRRDPPGAAGSVT